MGRAVKQAVNGKCQAALNLRGKRMASELSQARLCNLAEVSRFKYQLHEQGFPRLNDDEIRRVLIVLEHATKEARSTAAAHEKLVAERLRAEKEEAAASQ